MKLFLSAALVAFAAMLGATSAMATNCNLELSAGLGATDAQLNSSGTKIDLNQTGGLVGFGGGCDLTAPQTGPVLGVLARASVMRLIGDIGTDSIKSDRLYEVGGRIGWKWHNEFMPYVTAGWAWTNLDLPASSGLSSKQPNGPFVGAGLEARITGPWWMRGEYEHVFFDKQDAGSGVDIRPDLNLFRAALVYKFGDRAVERASLK